jgi:hypothetical protein
MVPESAAPTCPACQRALAKRPQAKTKCRHCGAFIYVRTRAGGGRWLLAEAELAAVEAEWAAKRDAAASAPPPPEPLWSNVHVVGESHRNPDGTSRQQLIRTRARTGLAVQLVPEPENLHDEDAVKVLLPTGEQLGYLSSDDAAELAEQRRAGWHHAALIHRVLGGTRDKPSRGVLLRLVSAPPGTTESEIRAALEDARTAPDPWDHDRGRAHRRDATPQVAITLELSPCRDPAVKPVENAPPEPARRPWAILIGVGLGLAGVLYLLTR